MDRVFLEYYEDELVHLRALGREFAALHPTVAGNLSLDLERCADPYVERLLEGVAYLAARTRMKVDCESPLFARNLLDFLYPDLCAPTPATGIVRFEPGPQIDSMPDGYALPAGTRLVSRLREGLSTRCVYTTAHPLRLWPVEIARAAYLQDRDAMRAWGLPGDRGAEAAVVVRLRRRDGGPLAEFPIDRLDLHLRRRPMGAELFDAIHGRACGILARPASADTASPARAFEAEGPGLAGLSDAEALFPRTADSFEGYRVLREYFANPDRFLFARVGALGPAVRACEGEALDIAILFPTPRPELAGVGAGHFALFCTPVVNLFERDCATVEADRRRTRFLLHADRTRVRDFEVYRVLTVEDQERDGPEAAIPHLFGFGAAAGSGTVYTVERRRRRPGEDELRRGRMRSEHYAGDDVFLGLSSAAEPPWPRTLRRLHVRALCTNRDLPIFDERPDLTIDGGNPVATVDLLGAVTKPQAALGTALPAAALAGDPLDTVAWRLVAQLALNHTMLTGPGGRDALRSLLAIYADRGDPAVARHAGALAGVETRAVVDRLPLSGPIAFAKGVEITLEMDEAMLTDAPRLMLGAVMDAVLARYASVNSFVRARTRLVPSQETFAWPMRLGSRRPI